MLSRLCSEWEEVGHIEIKHQQTKGLFFLTLPPPQSGAGLTPALRGFNALMIGFTDAFRIKENVTFMRSIQSV